MNYLAAALASAAVGWFVSDVLHWNLVVNLFLSTLTFGGVSLWASGQLGD